MLDPRICAIRAILAELDPLLTELAEYPIGFDLADELVRSQRRCSLFRISASGLVNGCGSQGRAEMQGGLEGRSRSVVAVLRRGKWEPVLRGMLAVGRAVDRTRTRMRGGWFCWWTGDW